MSDQKTILVQEFRQHQSKYVYYIIALCVTGIGFAIQKTNGQPLRYTQISLGLSVMTFSISIYCGIRFMHYVMNALYINAELIDVSEGRHHLTEMHPEKIKIGEEVLTGIINNSSTVTERAFKLQYRLFYLGIMFFVIWQVWEMYAITKK